MESFVFLLCLQTIAFTRQLPSSPTPLRGLLLSKLPSPASCLLRLPSPSSLRYSSILSLLPPWLVASFSLALIPPPSFKPWPPPHLHSLLPALRCLLDARNPISPPPPFFARLISSLGRAGLPLHAKHVFLAMPLFSCAPNLHTCTALLRALLSPTSTLSPSASACQVLALDLRMHTLDTVTFSVLMKWLVKQGKVDAALQLLKDMRAAGCPPNTVTYNSLIGGLVKANRSNEALLLLREMQAAGCPPNTITYTILIDGLLKANRSNEALLCLREMQEQGCSPNTWTFTVLTDWLVKEEEMEAAMSLVQIMPSMGCHPDIVTYTTLLHGLLKAGECNMAPPFISEMAREGCRPDVVICDAILNWLVKEGGVELAMQLLKQMPSMGCNPKMITYSTLRKVSLNLEHGPFKGEGLSNG